MYFDITMPLALFTITVVAMLLNKRLEGRLKARFEEREFRVRDAVLLVAAISVAISIIVFIPQMAIMAFFLFSYSMLLFIFTYAFSDMQKARAQIFSLAFGIVSFAAATISLLGFGTTSIMAYGTVALYCLSAFAFITLAYEKGRASIKERWYLAVLPPVLFILLYLFYNNTAIWFPYLFDTYAIIFAILVTLYLGTLFTWKTSLVFAGLLTVMDIILVLFTGSMVSAAIHVSSLGLPMLVSLPTIPLITTASGNLFMSLGLGDFFFAGLLAIQTYKKFGRDLAVSSAIGMSLSFAIFEAFLLNYEFKAFPGTLMIICGWLPFVVWKKLKP